MRARCLLPLSLLLVPALVAAGQDAAKAEKQKLQGTWRIQKLVTPAKLARQYEAEGKLVFEGDTFSIYLGKTKLVTNRYTLQEARLAKQIEATPLDGALKGEMSRGVYAFEGDTLKIVFADPGRPPLTRMPKGTARGMLILKRAAP
jgi:uncharacterized protein (TIGR03067 family)